MPAKLGVLFLHGMGTTKEGYADELTGRLRERVSAAGHPPGDVVYTPAMWGTPLDLRQDEVWARLDLTSLRYDKLRSFVFSSLGDASGYQWVADVAEDEVPIYRLVHEEVRRALAHLRAGAGGVDPPVIVVANSLGSHVISNYVWDAQRERGFPGADFASWSETEKLSRLAGLVMTGSNIPVLTLPHRDPKAVNFPGPNLPPAVSQAAEWLNFYDKDDVLGYPLRDLSASYRANVTEDVEVRIRSLLKRWNPLSHGKYWTDRTVIDRTSRLMVDVLAAVSG